MKTFEFDERFVEDLIHPISNITTMAVIKLNEAFASSLVINPSKTSIFYAEVPITSNIEEEISLNIINIAKFRNLLSYIKSGQTKIGIKDNYLSYKSEGIRFKFFLNESGIIKEPSVSIKNLKNFEGSNVFNLTKDNIASILRMKTISKEIDKIYLKFKDDGVYVEFTDKTVENCDSIEEKICDSYEGDTNTLGIPLPFEIIKHLARTHKPEFTVKYSSERKICLFEYAEDGVVLKFLIPQFIN